MQKYLFCVEIYTSGCGKSMVYCMCPLGGGGGCMGVGSYCPCEGSDILVPSPTKATLPQYSLNIIR